MHGDFFLQKQEKSVRGRLVNGQDTLNGFMAFCRFGPILQIFNHHVLKD